jgi:hypothetical protein
MENPVMTVAQFAQATWDRLFQEKQATVEVCYSAWMRAQDAQRANKKQEELQAASEERRQAYCQAASDLHTWLRSHPMQAANQATNEKRDASRWKDEEKALGVALMSILKRPPTGPEFEEARSLFHYSMGQFEEVAQAVARERETCG